MSAEPQKYCCAFQRADGVGCDFASADLAEFAQHTKGHAVDHFNTLERLENACRETEKAREHAAASRERADEAESEVRARDSDLATAREANRELSARFRTVFPSDTKGIGSGKWRLRNGKVALVGFRYEPARGGTAYWTGLVEDGGALQWDDQGRDLRGYDEFDLEERVG